MFNNNTFVCKYFIPFSCIIPLFPGKLPANFGEKNIGIPINKTLKKSYYDRVEIVYFGNFLKNCNSFTIFVLWYLYLIVYKVCHFWIINYRYLSAYLHVRERFQQFNMTKRQIYIVSRSYNKHFFFLKITNFFLNIRMVVFDDSNSNRTNQLRYSGRLCTAFNGVTQKFGPPQK